MTISVFDKESTKYLKSSSIASVFASRVTNISTCNDSPVLQTYLISRTKFTQTYKNNAKHWKKYYEIHRQSNISLAHLGSKTVEEISASCV